MFKKLFTVTFLLLCFSLMVYAQEESVLKPLGVGYYSKHNNPEVIFANPTKGTTVYTSSSISNPPLTGAILGTIDTLSYRRSIGGNPAAYFTFYSGDYILVWYEAPADLVIKQVGFASYFNATNTEVAVKIYKVGNGITTAQLLNAGLAVKQGTFKASDPSYSLGYAGFADESDGSGYINASPGKFAAFPFAEDIWSDAGFGLTIVPLATIDAPAYQFVNTIDLGFEPTVNRGEIFAIVIKNNGTTFNAEGIGFWYISLSASPSPWSWKYYVHGKTDGDSSTAYWYSREYLVDFAAVVDLVGDRPPVVQNILSLGTTLSTAPRTVTADITDDNPSGSTPGGVTAAVLQWTIDGGTTWNDVAMSNTGGNTYSGDIPGQASGANVSYKIKATDDNSGTSESLPKSYKIFIKTQDVLFIYNNAMFSANDARRLYIGYTSGNYIVDPVLNDIWRAADGTAEASGVMSLYKWVIQVDGAFPSADFSVAAKAYLDGATTGNERNYFLSSQDYGCLISNCADTTFLAGSLQYDYMGVATLGPQDFVSTKNAEMTPVAGDPLSGWVSTYNTDSSVTYRFNPSFELALAFSPYPDKLTPTASATTIFTSGGASVGVRNEGANWKTAFIAFDYAGCDFRSDTSIAIEADPPEIDPKYAWGINVENQALAFLTWAGFVTGIETVNPNVPDKFNLAQNYPNPFNPTTNIRFDIQNTSQVELRIYDVLGKEVQTLVNSQLSPGTYSANFDASRLASGVYFYTIKAGDFVSSKKMMLIK